jgi:RNA polymerase sigma-70 factor (ECF subfamily)
MRTAWRFTGNRQDAEDLLQDVLLKLYPQMDTLRQVEQLRPWLVQVLYHSFIDSTRRRKQAGLQLALVGEHDQDQEDTVALAADETGEPDARMLQGQLRHRLEQALSRLDESQRALITLHDMEGYSVEEVAGVLDIPAGTVKSRLHRLRARLRRFIKMEPFIEYERVRKTEEAKS